MAKGFWPMDLGYHLGSKPRILNPEIRIQSISGGEKTHNILGNTHGPLKGLGDVKFVINLPGP